MKNLYVLGAVLAMTFSNAQSKKSFNKQNKTTTAKTFVSNLKASEVKFNQAPDFTNGIISMVDQDNNQIFAADDFQLSASTKIDKFVFYGSQFYDDLPDYYLGTKMYIFNDNNGVPAGKPSNANQAIAVINIDENNTSTTVTGSEGDFTFEVKVAQALGKDLILEGNKKYWVAFAPKVDLGDEYGADGDETFYWALGSSNYAKPVLIDEEDLFEAGATTWTPISDLIGEAFDGLAFSITGESSLGTQEVYSNVRNVSIYPNPTTNVINLKSNKGKNISKTEIFDMNGKLIISSSETSINVENLPKTTYVIKVYSGSEVVEVSKIIKK